MMKRPSYCVRGWIGLWSIMMLGAALVAPSSPVAHAAGAEITLDTITAKAGRTLTVRGRNFQKGEVVASWASSASGAVFPTGAADADRYGDIVLMITVKRFWEPTWWAITLRGESSTQEAVATFKVEAVPPDGALAVSPTAIAVGARINFKGSGFSDGESVKAWATRPDLTAVPLTDQPQADPRAVSGGDVYFFYDVPAAGPAGSWYMTAYGTRSERLLVVAFTVTR